MDTADAVGQVKKELRGIVRTATVSGTSGTKVIVTVDGSSMTLPRLASYTPTIADVVLILAVPGAWIVLGKPA